VLGETCDLIAQARVAVVALRQAECAGAHAPLPRGTAGRVVDHEEDRLQQGRRARCLAHRMRNLQSKVPDAEWPEFREKAKAAY